MGITAAFMVPHPPLIVPDVGKGEERKIADTIEAYRRRLSSFHRIRRCTRIISIYRREKGRKGISDGSVRET